MELAMYNARKDVVAEFDMSEFFEEVEGTDDDFYSAKFNELVEAIKEAYHNVEVEGVFAEEESHEFEVTSDIESENFEELFEVLKDLSEFDADELEWLEAYIEVTNDELQCAMNSFQYNSTYYSGQSLSEVAYDLAEEMLDSYNVPEEVRRYFDYDSYENDLSYEYTETSWGTITTY